MGGVEGSQHVDIHRALEVLSGALTVQAFANDDPGVVDQQVHMTYLSYDPGGQCCAVLGTRDVQAEAPSFMTVRRDFGCYASRVVSAQVRHDDPGASGSQAMGDGPAIALPSTRDQSQPTLKQAWSDLGVDLHE